MSNVRNTLVNALPSGAQAAYPREFDAVLAALTERDYALTDAIAAEVANRTSYSEEQAKSQLAALGMALRPAPEPEPVVVAAPDMSKFEAALTEDASAPKAKKAKKGKKSEVAKLAKVVNQLVKAARRHGVSI